MIISDITEISKTKVKVCVDNEEVFALYKGELSKYHLKKDEEISEEVYDTLINEVLIKRARLRSLNLLKSRDYTEYQLRSKLKQGFYPNRVIGDAVEYVKAYGYVDDVRYAKSYIGYAGTSKSRRQIENDLIKKGISKNDLEKAYDECCQEGAASSEEEVIKKLMEKKCFISENATVQERRKMIGFLYRKGFSLDKIYKAVGQIVL